MIFLSLKIAGLVVGIWAGVKLSGIGIAWLRHYFKEMRPPEDY